MLIVFYIASIVAVIATILAITRTNAVHALLYLIISLLSVAVVFFVMGAHFVAALEVIVYAGAIMVLFIFVIMMLNIGTETETPHSQWLTPKTWGGPALLALVLFIEMAYIIATKDSITTDGSVITPKQVGLSLYTEYILGVELAAVMLMAGIIGAYHIGRTKRKSKHRFLEGDNV
jgi:NADH-quinone oxidoreductase subunit J